MIKPYQLQHLQLNILADGVNAFYNSEENGNDIYGIEPLIEQLQVQNIQLFVQVLDTQNLLNDQWVWRVNNLIDVGIIDKLES